MQSRTTTRIATALVLTLAAAAAAQDQVTPHAQDRPPNPPKSPAEAIAAMTVPDGFSVELVAGEPDLVNPVSMTFDEKGRIWVTESLEYPRREPGPGRDRVKVLEDTDGDGRVDKTTIFAEGLNIPSGIAVGHGGVWVANAPDILFYPNADGDLVPDGEPQVVATGFGRDDTHELPNSLTWGPDGWLYGWNGVFNPSEVKSNNGETYEFTCAIYRINPATREFRLFCEGTSNPWGIAVNADGELFASACVIDHLWHLVEGAYYIRQGGPYPPHTAPMDSIVDHNHQKAAYCGIHWFDSDAYPPEYRGKLYMGNIHGNCINVDELERAGSTYKGKARPDFLSANDAWFMPVSQKTGPDGCLYVLDWYDRYHCYQDANRDPAGIDRLKGRLYRVRYKDTPRATIDLASKSSVELMETLGAPNDFLRSTARRILVERGLRKAEVGDGPADRFDPARLTAAIKSKETPRTKALESLWVVASLDTIRGRSPNGNLYQELLGHDDPTFRAWAVRTRAAIPTRTFSTVPAAGEANASKEPLPGARSDDTSPIVRRQAVIAAGKAGRIEALARTLVDVPEDPLIAHLVWQNLHPRLDSPEAVGRWLEAAVHPEQGRRSPAVAALWPRVIERVVAEEEVDGQTLARVVLTGVDQLDADDGLRRRMLDTLTAQIREGDVAGERLEALRAGLSEHVAARMADPSNPIAVDFVELAGSWGDESALSKLRGTLADPNAHPAARLEALDVLVARRHPGILDAVGPVLTAREAPDGFRERVIEALGRLDSPRVAEVALDAFDRMDPSLRPRVVELLTQRPAWSLALVRAVEAKKVPAASVHVNQLRRLQASRDPEVVRMSRELWGTVREGYNEQRTLVVGQMRNFLHKTPGDPSAGQKVFAKLCAQCHKIYGEGQDVGPDITLNGRNDFDQLISNVFDPNLVIGAGYQATTVATTDGRVLTGLLAEDSKERVVLKTQGGKVEAVPRAEVEEMKTSPISLMPEDVENQLTPREIADLFSYLALDKPPTDPAARRLPGSPEEKPSSGGGR
jgi:putative heme-binding domain-containing protein